LKQIAAHYEIGSLAAPGRDERQVYCYEVTPREVTTHASGRVRLSVGFADVRSRITEECAELSFGVIHFGDHNLNAGVRDFQGEERFHRMAKEISAPFDEADLPEVLRILDQHFNGVRYSLRSLVGDEQKRIINAILDSTMEEAETSFRNVYEHHAPLMRFLGENGLPIPQVLRTTAEFVMQATLRRAFESDFIDLDEARLLLNQAQRLNLHLDTAGLGYVLANSITRLIQELAAEPGNTGLMQKAIAILDMVKELSFPVDLWRAQNIYFEMLREGEPRSAGGEDEESRQRIRLFRELGDRLWLRLRPSSSERAPAQQAA
jgi:hypothetical protein